MEGNFRVIYLAYHPIFSIKSNNIETFCWGRRGKLLLEQGFLSIVVAMLNIWKLFFKCWATKKWKGTWILPAFISPANVRLVVVHSVICATCNLEVGLQSARQPLMNILKLQLVYSLALCLLAELS